MAYSIVGIWNMALQRIGAQGRITALDDGTPNAIKINAVWEYIRDEVLEDIKPKFATVRKTLAQSATEPANIEVYAYAYPLPSDYLCLADGIEGDPPIWPEDIGPYVLETLSPTDESLSLMTNYDSVTADQDVYLTYVKRLVNPAKYPASFINALAFRLAAELTFSIVESAGKYQAMMQLYDRAKKKARAASLDQDYLRDEKGSDSWETAGR